MLRIMGNIRKFVVLVLAAAAIPVAVGCATDRPPAQQGSFHKPDLVELSRLDPGIHLDIRYATADNIVHRPVYREARAFLQRPAAQAITRAHREVASKGYGLLVFDGYRPYAGGTGQQRARRDLLRAAMEKEGFTVEENEWWHFNFRDWKDYPILDIPFEAIP
jgi:D-alanyl-D-alanine dipeptidase